MLQTFIKDLDIYNLTPVAEKIFLTQELFIYKPHLEEISQNYQDPSFLDYYKKFDITDEEMLSIELLDIWKQNEVYSQMREGFYNDFKINNPSYEAELSDLRDKKQELKNTLQILINESNKVLDELSEVYIDAEHLKLKNSNEKLAACNQNFEKANIELKKKEILPIMMKLN